MVVGSIMADEEVLDCLRDANSESQPDEEVFANGDEDSSRDSNSFLHPEYGSTPEQVMPRKSSLIKDTSRRNRRKKTVSFSSMPGERTVVNGKLSRYFSFETVFNLTLHSLLSSTFHSNFIVACVQVRVFRQRFSGLSVVSRLTDRMSSPLEG